MLCACSNSIYYNSEFHSDNTLSELENFSWYGPDTNEVTGKKIITDESMVTGIRENINNELLGRNFKLLSNPDQADFLINYSLFTVEKTELQSFRSTHGYSAGWGFADDYHVATGYQDYPVRNVLDTFVLDIINTKDNKLIWRGIATGRIR